MFGRKTKKIQRVPTQEEMTELIGEQIDGHLITNIEVNGQIRTLPAEKFDEWKNAIPKWKKRNAMVGLQKHPGSLMTQHESAEMYETISNNGLYEYHQEA